GAQVVAHRPEGLPLVPGFDRIGDRVVGVELFLRVDVRLEVRHEVVQAGPLVNEVLYDARRSGVAAHRCDADVELGGAGQRDVEVVAGRALGGNGLTNGLDVVEAARRTPRRLTGEAGLEHLPE